MDTRFQAVSYAELLCDLVQRRRLLKVFDFFSRIFISAPLLGLYCANIMFSMIARPYQPRIDDEKRTLTLYCHRVEGQSCTDLTDAITFWFFTLLNYLMTAPYFYRGLKFTQGQINNISNSCFLVTSKSKGTHFLKAYLWCNSKRGSGAQSRNILFRGKRYFATMTA